jgi:hypothetical protein
MMWPQFTPTLSPALTSMTLLLTGDWKPDLQAMFASLTLLTIVHCQHAFHESLGMRRTGVVGRSDSDADGLAAVLAVHSRRR